MRSSSDFLKDLRILIGKRKLFVINHMADRVEKADDEITSGTKSMVKLVQ